MSDLDAADTTEDTVRYRYNISFCRAEIKKGGGFKHLLMFPFSIALTSGLKRQSVEARVASIPGSSSFRDIAKFVKLYICAREKRAARIDAYWYK